MRTIYLGHNPNYASTCYEESELMAVFWHGGQGNLAKRTERMIEFCGQKGIVTVHHSKLDYIIKQMVASLLPDLIVIGEYHYLLKKEFIDIPRYGAINMHGAPLPRYRGAHPINWMVINGEKEGAVTCHYVSEELDNGDIIAQNTFPILDTETAYDVRPKIEAAGRRLLADVLRRFATEGKLAGDPQDESKALYTPPRKPSDGLIDWNTPPKKVYDFVRALTKPYPGAFAMCQGTMLYIWRIEMPKIENTCPDNAIVPGTVIEISHDGFMVAVSGGSVKVIDWEIDGRDIKINDLLIGKHDDKRCALTNYLIFEES